MFHSSDTKVITNDLCDGADIKREIRNMFIHCNMLTRKLYQRSLDVKLTLLRSSCLCFYDSTRLGPLGGRSPKLPHRLTSLIITTKPE